MFFPRACLSQAIWKVNEQEPAREFQAGNTGLSPTVEAAVAHKYAWLLLAEWSVREDKDTDSVA